MKTQDILQEIAISSFIARAILNDYAETQSKIENVPAENIIQRVYTAANVLRDEFVQKQEKEKKEQSDFI
jgi:hypothetical protein